MPLQGLVGLERGVALVAVLVETASGQPSRARGSGCGGDAWNSGVASCRSLL